jgi:hypothetical protein
MTEYQRMAHRKWGRCSAQNMPICANWKQKSYVRQSGVRDLKWSSGIRSPFPCPVTRRWPMQVRSVLVQADSRHEQASGSAACLGCHLERSGHIQVGRQETADLGRASLAGRMGTARRVV